jgi:hypothetical protein
MRERLVWHRVIDHPHIDGDFEGVVRVAGKKKETREDKGAEKIVRGPAHARVN